MKELDSDDAAMSRIARGDESGLTEIMERWKPKLATFLFRFVGDTTNALELTEETFVRVYQERARYKPCGKFASWLFQIAANLARHRLRWKQRHPEVSLDELEEKGAFEPSQESQEDPSAELEQKERGAAIQQAILALPEDQRAALIFQEFENLSVREIAVIQSSTEKAVENRLGRARKTLREKLKNLLREA